MYDQIFAVARKWGRLLAAMLVLNIIGVVVSTQFNLGHLLALGVEVSFATRIQTTLFDILSMQPLFGAIFGTGFFIAMIVGHFIAKWVKKYFPTLFSPWRAFAAMAVTLMALKAAFNITAIGAAREWDGFFKPVLWSAHCRAMYFLRANASPNRDRQRRAQSLSSAA